MTSHANKAHVICLSALLWLLCLLLFVLMAYGGIRTPDGEVVFRVGESLARSGTFAVEQDLEAWPGFGLPSGKDGRRYSLFGPAQSILLTPLIKTASNFNNSRWYECYRIPVSFTADQFSFRSYILRQRPPDMAPHALRFLVSFFTPLVASLAVVLQFCIIWRLTGHAPAAFLSALLFGLATPLWHYSGTMFTEPLAVLFSLASFYLLIPGVTRPDDGIPRYGPRALWAGLLLGLAFATHISAVLSVPFFLMFALYPCIGREGPFYGHKRACAAIGACFLAGFCAIAALYGWYNQVRFGSIWETGRTAPSPVVYDVFTNPWEGLAGLLASPGKGIFWFFPILVAAIVWWPRFHRRYPCLSFIVMAMGLSRLLFFACRSNWHSGFCLGTRYVLLALPFLLIPIGFRLKDFFAEGRSPAWRPVAAGLFLFACIVQQIYFCLGEPISFYYQLKMAYLRQGISIIADNRIYFQWGASPLLHLFEGRRGPFLLQPVSLDQWALLAVCSLGMALLLGLVVFCLIRADGRRYK